jgi:hypothetical protein
MKPRWTKLRVWLADSGSVFASTDIERTVARLLPHSVTIAS